MDLRNMDKLRVFMKEYENGNIIYKDGFLWRTIKRVNQSKTVRLEEPKKMRMKGGRYPRISIYGFTFYEHILIYLIHHGLDKLKSIECIDHKDDNKWNNLIDNLEGVTIEENNKRAKDNGLLVTLNGEDNGHHKLTSKDIQEIKDLYKNRKFTQYQLADLYNVTQGHISVVVNNKKRTVS